MAKLLLMSAGFYNERMKTAFIRLCDQKFDKMKTANITTAVVEHIKNERPRFSDVRFRYADIFCFSSVCCAAFFTCG
jgi:hypothetical protein